MSQPNEAPQWDDMSRLPGMRSVLDPGDTRGSRNDAIDKSQKHALQGALQPARGATILDLGCGIGRITSWLDTSGMKAVGLDSSQGMLSVAKGNAPRAAFIRASAAALPFRSGIFDAIVSVFVLQYLVADGGSLAEGLTECRRVLRSGASIAAIEQVNDGDQPCGGTIEAYRDGFRAAGFNEFAAIPARLSDSRVLEHVRRRPFVGRLPGIASLVGYEARSRRGHAMRDDGYADYLFVARTRLPGAGR